MFRGKGAAAPGCSEHHFQRRQTSSGSFLCGLGAKRNGRERPEVLGAALRGTTTILERRRIGGPPGSLPKHPFAQPSLISRHTAPPSAPTAYWPGQRRNCFPIGSFGLLNCSFIKPSVFFTCLDMIGLRSDFPPPLTPAQPCFR